LHYNMDKAIEALLSNLERTGQVSGGKLVTLDGIKGKKATKIHTYYFDYNTVEQVLIACGIFLSLIAIMFESGQFYVVDPETGLETLSNDPSDAGFYTTILVAGALVLFGSITYYLVVFMAEVMGTLPKFLAACFAKKHRHKLGERENQDESLEMVQNPKFHGSGARNPIAVAQLEKTRKIRDEAKQYAAESQQLEAAQNALASEVRRLRAQNQRVKLEGRTTPSRARNRRQKPEFAQEALGDDSVASKNTTWTRMAADEDGEYFVNDATGQTSWELPRGHTAHD